MLIHFMCIFYIQIFLYFYDVVVNFSNFIYFRKILALYPLYYQPGIFVSNLELDNKIAAPLDRNFIVNPYI